MEIGEDFSYISHIYKIHLNVIFQYRGLIKFKRKTYNCHYPCKSTVNLNAYA